MADRDLHSAYGQAGVNYAVLDAGKRDALSEALATSHWLAGMGAEAIDDSRGEPAFVLRFGGSTLAFVLETLGTKSIIAREHEEKLLEVRAISQIGEAGCFADVAYDTVAAVLNDLICVGALPLVLNAYFATGSSEWYAQEARARAMLAGWRRACDDARCTWGGGESPALSGLVACDDLELAGSALGFVPPPGEPLLGERLAPGDEIVLVASSGLHANGASLARRVAAQLPDGWLTQLADGERFGDALLRPSALYVELVRRLLGDPHMQLSYLSHITGHGLLKLMRPRRELTYRIHTLPPVPPVLELLARHSQLDKAAYSTLNMGTGFAVYCRPSSSRRVLGLAAQLGLHALLAGTVEEGARQVVLEPADLVMTGDQLDLAPPQDDPASQGS